jgi:hypothetical protein
MMAASPRRVFSLTPTCDGDSMKAYITSIICTEDGNRLVLADNENKKVKVVYLQHPTVVSASLSVDEGPWAWPYCMTALSL